MATPRYQHKGLDTRLQQIRLLRILHNPNRATPRVVLEHFELHQAPPFTALSYTWAPAMREEDIFISDAGREMLPLRIGRNLGGFLRMFRHKEKGSRRKTWLWIDQICIDQADEKEKSHQVAQMVELYQRAEKVIVWLGKAFKGSNRLLDSIEQYYADELEPPECGSWSIGETLGLWWDLRRQLQALDYFLSLDYWSRLWVCQEIVLARELVFHVGHREMEWLKLAKWASRASKVFIGLRSHTREISEKFLRLTRLAQNKLYRYDDERVHESWSSVLEVCENTRCANVRDKVYGMQGLVHPKVRITVDYNMDAVQLLHEIIREEVAFMVGAIPKRDRKKDQSLLDVSIEYLQNTAIAMDGWRRELQVDDRLTSQETDNLIIGELLKGGNRSVWRQYVIPPFDERAALLQELLNWKRWAQKHRDGFSMHTSIRALIWLSGRDEGVTDTRGSTIKVISNGERFTFEQVFF